MKNKLPVIMLITITLILTIVGISSAQDTLVFATSGDAARLDPGDVTDNESMERMDNIF